MRIHWKLLILLLIFSLTPMLAMYIVSRHSVRDTGRIIAGNTRTELTSIVSRELAQTAEYHARTIRRNRNNLELALNILANDAEESLSRKPFYTGRVYYAEDFDTPAKAPSDLAPSMRYPIKKADGLYEASKVSFAHPVVYVSPGADKRDFLDESRSLTAIFSAFRRLAENDKQPQLERAYVSLADGLHISWPGHGNFPPNYDSRKRPWYTNAASSDGVFWSAPMSDASTGKLVFTASEAIRDKNGTVQGVAGLDVPLAGLLQVKDMVSQWSLKMRAFLVYAGSNPKTGKKGLWVVAEQSFTDGKPKWSGGDFSIRLESENTALLGALENEVVNEKSGYAVLPYKGVPSIWAHSTISDNTSLLIIVPMNVVDKLPEQAADSIMGLVNREAQTAAGTGAGVLVLVLLAAFLGSRHITRPFNRMAEAAGSLADGDFSTRINEKFHDERDKLVQSFNEMVPRLEEHLRMRESLELASEIQQNLLPQKPPTVPGLDVYGRSVPCDETGGDYFDYIENAGPEQNRLGVVVGDVTGHGVPAALLMTTGRAVIRGMGHGTAADDVADAFDLGKRVERLNSVLTMDLSDTSRFMTLLWMEIDPAARTCYWVRAGHDPALTYDPAADRFEELWGDGGLVLGVAPDMEYDQNEETLPAGSILLIGTDGIWEAFNAAEEMYGKERLMNVIRESADQPAEEIVQAVLNSVASFRGAAPITDDITLVVVKFV